MKLNQEQIKNVIRQTLIETREKRKIKKQEAATNLGIARQTFSNYEKGISSIPGELMTEAIYYYGERLSVFDKALAKETGDLLPADKDYIANHLPSVFRSMIEETMKIRQNSATMSFMFYRSGRQFSSITDDFHEGANLMIRSIEDLDGIKQNIKDVVCNIIAVNEMLFEMNSDLLISDRESLSETQQARLTAYLKFIEQLYKLTDDAMYSLVPSEDEPIVDFEKNGRIPITVEGFTFYVDKDEAERFLKKPFSYRYNCPPGIVYVETSEGNLFVDVKQAEEFERYWEAKSKHNI